QLTVWGTNTTSGVRAVEVTDSASSTVFYIDNAGLTWLKNLLATASSTIGGGTQTTGLTIFGGATTTGKSYFADNVGIGTTSPGTLLSINNSANFVASATSTIYNGLATPVLNLTSTTASSTAANGINLTGGCFSINGTCTIGSGGGVLLGTYSTSTPGSNVQVVFTGAAGSQPSFSAGVLTLPSNTSYIETEVWGAGGGGGGGGGDGVLGGGSGAGAGGYTKKLITSPSGSYYYTIGAGGAGGAAVTSGAGNNGNDGGQSCFGTNSTACTSPILTGSAGSAGGGARVTDGAPLAGGSGGSASGGDINLTGSAGEIGGTGKAASQNGPGGSGGAAPLGGGGGRGGNVCAAGDTGKAPGGGGGGSASGCGATPLGGTGGAGGLVINVYTTISANGTSGGQLLGIYSTSTPGTNVTVNLNGTAGSAPSFSAGVLTLPSNASTVIVKLVGGGGGGGPGGTVSSNGGTGGNTTFSTLTAGGGVGGQNCVAGTGGTTSGSPNVGVSGSDGESIQSGGGSAMSGGSGGASYFGGQGSAGTPSFSTLSAGKQGTGGGGGGGYTSNNNSWCSGGGGGAGGYVEHLYTSPSGTYTYSVGAGGTAGVTSGNGGSGAAGGSGGIVIEVYATGLTSGSAGTGTAGQVSFYGAVGNQLTATSSIFINTTNSFVGIGTSTPGSTFTIQGGDGNNGGLLVTSAGATTPTSLNLARNGGSGDALFGIAGISGNYWTSAAAGDAILRAISGNLHLATGYSTGGLTLNTSGNVGIGSTSPNYMLDVGGDVNIAAGKCYRVNGVCIGYVKRLALVFATSSVTSNTKVDFSAASGASSASTTYASGLPTIVGLPVSASEIVTEVWGGGGGGGTGAGCGTNPGGGGGGGSGAYSQKLYTGTLASQYFYNIGAAGSAGGAGGNSSFGTGSATSTANGGSTGGNASEGSGGSGGAAGTATGGDLNLTGEQGSQGNWASCGATGGTGGDGGNAPRGGRGGTGPMGAAGGTGQVFGGAGGGGAAGSSAGGAGGAGGIVITVYATSSPTAAGNDYAEMFPVSSPSIGAADIVAVDVGAPVSMKLARRGDAALAGVIATQPGQVLGDINAPGQRPVALAGRVPVKFSTENGPVKLGDRIAPSSIPGVGMKAGPFDDSVGIVIGNMEDGKVMVFLDLQQGLNINAIALGLLNLPAASAHASASQVDFVGGLLSAISSRISIASSTLSTGSALTALNSLTYFNQTEVSSAENTQEDQASTPLESQGPLTGQATNALLEYVSAVPYTVQAIKELGAQVEELSTTSTATSTPFADNFWNNVYSRVADRLALSNTIVAVNDHTGATTNATELVTSRPDSNTSSQASAEQATSTYIGLPYVSGTTTPWIASFAEASQSLKGALTSLSDTVIQVLGNAVYAVTGVFDQVFTKELVADNVFGERGTFRELCVGNVCVSEEQFMKVFGDTAEAQSAAAAASAVQSPESEVISENTASSTLPHDLGLQTNDSSATSTPEIIPTENASSTLPIVSPSLEHASSSPEIIDSTATSSPPVETLSALQQTEEIITAESSDPTPAPEPEPTPPTSSASQPEQTPTL
ncbi:hypothetical protein HY969_01445, partial [Candidatus Kaiserbacteria bacterium]|nr:hypothetical protein [Candidatus Kaiserbacteria bacterium]